VYEILKNIDQSCSL